MHPRSGWLFIALLALLTMAACGGDDTGGGDAGGDDATGNAGCDPFEVAPHAIELAELIAAGRAQTGTLYVVDSDEGDLRAFRGDGDGSTLVRLRVNGSGSSGTGSSAFYTLSVEDPPERFALLVAQDANGVRMARGPEDAAREPPPEGILPGENLEIVEASELEDFEVIDALTDVVVGYFAATPDGRRLMVIAPEDSEDLSSIRVFFGQGSHLSERAFISYEVQRDGGSAHILFDLDGEQADAFFPVMLTPDDGVVRGDPTLEVGGEITPLTRLTPTPDVLDALELDCLP
jgi:hypothetical protein